MATICSLYYCLLWWLLLILESEELNMCDNLTAADCLRYAPNSTSGHLGFYRFNMKGLGKAVISLIRPKPHEVSKTVGKCTIIDSFKRRYLAKRNSLIRGPSQCRSRDLRNNNKQALGWNLCNIADLTMSLEGNLIRLRRIGNPGYRRSLHEGWTASRTVYAFHVVLGTRHSYIEVNCLNIADTHKILIKLLFLLYYLLDNNFEDKSTWSKGARRIARMWQKKNADFSLRFWSET
jgi:hypothetical protein